MLYYRRGILLWSSLLFLQAFNCQKTSKQLLQNLDPESRQEEEEMIDGMPMQTKLEDVTDANQEAALQIGQKHDGPNATGNKAVLNKNQVPKINFEAIIQKLREQADKRRGIHWRLEGDNLLRDVVNASGQIYAAEDYAVQVLNIYRAAKKICEIYGKNSDRFVDMANKFMAQYERLNYAKAPEQFWVNKLIFLNTEVIEKLQKSLCTNENSTRINQKLRLAENYVGLDDTHYNITTTFQVGNHRFALEDKKWLHLTSKQQMEFTNRKAKQWYQRLEPFEQKLLDSYLPKFLDGSHYVPTQIRYIPGCRNAYEKRVLVYDQMGRSTVLGRYYHSGALASFVEDPVISAQIANHNWEQVCEFTNNKNLEVISLNHNVSIPVFGEKFIVEQTNRIVGKDAFIYLPINHIGTFTTPIFKENINKLLQEIATLYSDKYPDLSHHLVNNNSCALSMKTEANASLAGQSSGEWVANNKMGTLQEKIQAVGDFKDKAFLEKARFLKEATENSDGKNKFIHNLVKMNGNYYADIGSQYITCKAVLAEKRAHASPSVLFSCKSGKDRTGFMSYLVDAALIRMATPSLDSDANEDRIYKTLAAASHQQLLSSLNGGMPGRFGMKGVRKNAAMYAADVSNQLFPRAAQTTVISVSSSESDSEES